MSKKLDTGPSPLDFFGAFDICSPLSVAAALLARRPDAIPTLPHFSMPDFSSFEPLAAIAGASADSRMRATAALAEHRAHTSDALVSAAALVGVAAAEITAIAFSLARQAAVIPAMAMMPGGPAAAASYAAGISTLALVEVKSVEDTLRTELDAIANRLSGHTAALLAEAMPSAGALEHAARAELDRLAALAAPLAKAAGLPEPPRTTAAATVPAPAPPEVTPVSAPPPEPTPAAGSAVGAAAVEAAKSQLGTPYVWGGSAPGGFDCSGLTSWAYRQAGMDIPRIAADQAIGRQVSYEELQPGDLAVWDGHVAMYAGDGMYIEAGDPVSLNPVRTDNIGMTFRGFWRPTG